MTGFITEIVCQEYHIKPQHIRQKQKPDRQEMKDARSILCYHYVRIGLSTDDVGLLTNLSLTAIYKGIKKVEERVANKDPLTLKVLNRLKI